MRILPLALALAAALPAAGVQAAYKTYEIRYQQAVVEDGRHCRESRRTPFGFRMEVVSDSQGVKREDRRDGRIFVGAVKGERYSVRLTNPLPVRVAVNLTVDGLNSIDGKPCGISDGPKWIIEPHSSVTIPGWQVSGGEARRFFFTDKPKSYAKWRGDRTGRDLAANCGVIGAAFFWDRDDLQRYYDEHPVHRRTDRFVPHSSAHAKAGSSAEAPACAPSEASLDARAEKREAEQAGTGMGERESHPTVQVEFRYDTGMYKLSQALVIHYDFEREPAPNPFPELGFAPEMP